MSAAGPRLRRRRTFHVVATYDGRRLRVYVNGRLRAGRAARGAIAHRRGRDLFLARRPGRGRRFKGRLDEVALYRRALTRAAVRRHFRARR